MSYFFNRALREPGCSEKMPLRIYTPMKLKVGSDIGGLWIISPKFILVNKIMMLVNKPILILTGRNEITFDPLEKLGPAFVKGWRKCPDEIKQQILGYILMQEKVVTACRRWCNRLFVALRTPEMAGMVTEAFYKNNTFRAEMDDLSTLDKQCQRAPSNLSYCVRPPMLFSHLIRSLQIEIKPQFRFWYHLNRFAGGEYGFSNLQRVTVCIDKIWVHTLSWQIFADALRDEPSVKFNCQGSFTLLPHNGDDMVDDETILQLLRSKIQFRSDEDVVPALSLVRRSDWRW